MRKITEIPRLIPRPLDGHKGLFGKVLLVGGSVGFSGAVALAGRGALRAGAGLVRIAVPRTILPIAASFEPCYTTIALAEDADGQMSCEAAGLLANCAKENDVAAFGPGAGNGSGVRDCLFALLQIEGLRLVVDADGLNVMAQTPGFSGWLKNVKASVVITPHPGEMERLWKSLFRRKMPARRDEQARQMAEHTGFTVVLKGHETIITDASCIYVNTTGNPGMATAGSGDVLTGVIAALMGQKLNNLDAAILGAYIHGRAGDMAVEKKGTIGLIATDIIDYLPESFLKIQK